MKRNFLFLHTGSNDDHSTYLVGSGRGSRGLCFSPSKEVDGSRLAMWRLTDDDHLELAQRPGTILGVAENGSLELRHHSSGTHASSHRWKIEGATICHLESGRPIAVRRSGPTPVGLALSDDDDGSGETATIEQLGKKIEDILNEPASDPSFPAFPGKQADAYCWVNQQILTGTPYTDIRQLYTQANIQLGPYSNEISNLPYPTDGAVTGCDGTTTTITTSDLDAVKSQLTKEIRYASTVIALYASNLQFYTDTINGQSNRLEQIEDALKAVAQSPWNANLVLAVFFENVLYAVFSLLGPTGGFVANVMAAAFNTAVVAGAFNTEQQTIDLSRLVSQLSTQLAIIKTKLTQQEDAILGDWKRIQDVNGLGLTGTNSQLEAAIQAGTYSYLTQVLQSVLPPLCQIVGSYFTQSTTIDNVPADAQYVYDGGAGRCLFYVEMQSDDPFPETIASILFRNPVVPPDQMAFFLGLDGWNWSIRKALAPYNGGADLVTMVVNDTPDAVELKVEAQTGSLLQPTSHSTTTVALSAGSVGFIVSNGNHFYDIRTAVKIRDTSGKHNLAEFHACQGDEDTWVAGSTDHHPYKLSKPQIFATTTGVSGQILATFRKR